MKTNKYQIRKFGADVQLLPEIYETIDAAHDAIASLTKDYPARSGKNLDSVMEAQSAFAKRAAQYPEYQIVLQGGESLPVRYLTRDGKTHS